LHLQKDSFITSDLPTVWRKMVLNGVLCPDRLLVGPIFATDVSNRNVEEKKIRHFKLFYGTGEETSAPVRQNAVVQTHSVADRRSGTVKIWSHHK
jgi:hypothetical protein